MNETELLFTEVLNCSRQSLYLDKSLVLSVGQSPLISSVLKRRIKGEPIQYILGKTEFMGIEFKVTPDVFIPRPETEIVVEKAIDLVHSSEFMVHSILDIGTGSGCIAVSLAKNLPAAEITAIDISEDAIRVAKENALRSDSKINFLISDLFSNRELRTMNYELIISNPPYIPSAEIEKLQPEIKYEPRIALDGGPDGLGFYRRIISEATRYLKEGGFLLMEMGYSQKEEIKNIFQNSGYFEIIEFVKDYRDIDRVIIAKYKL